MKELNKYREQISKLCGENNVRMLLAFGSVVNDTLDEDSDIDLYVVTKDEFIPQSFKERMDITLKVSEVIRDLRGRIAIDLIVHTKKMADKFKELNSSFARELFSRGRVLL